MKSIIGLLLFVFFVFVFFLILLGGRIYRAILKFRQAAQQAADEQAQRYRNETGRQRQQYSHGARTAGQRTSQQQTAQQQTQQRTQQQQAQQAAQQEQPRHTQTSTGETIIDHRHSERNSKKIFDDNDGEYVDYTEA